MNITNKFWMDDKMELIWNKQNKICKNHSQIINQNKMNSNF